MKVLPWETYTTHKNQTVSNRDGSNRSNYEPNRNQTFPNRSETDQQNK